jgi:hypothetical protein
MNLTLFDEIRRPHVVGVFSDRCTLIAVDRRVVPVTAGWHGFDALLAGMDERDVLRGRLSDLDAFQRMDRAARPWVWPDGT